MTVEVDGVRKAYGRRTVLGGIRLSVKQGEILALLGPNGAGKSTLLKCLVGLVHPSGGTIEIDGIDLRREPRRALALIGFVPQRISAPAHLTVQEVLTFYAALKGKGPDAVGQTLERIGMAQDRQRRVGALSGGMMQRLGLAQSLLAEPPLLILDEPTVGLDPFVSSQFRELLASLHAKGTTIILASHQLGEVERLATRVAILKEGHIVTIGSVGQLLTASGLPSFVWITPTGELDAAEQRLAALSLPAQRFGSSLRISADCGNSLATIDAIRGAGIGIQAFWTSTPSLEEVFRWYVERGH